MGLVIRCGCWSWLALSILSEPKGMGVPAGADLSLSAS